MKKYTYLSFFVFLTLVLTTQHGLAQDSANFKIINPYDSLLIDEVKASGNLSSSTLQITMIFKNISKKRQTLHLDLGGFDDFGITTMSNKRYKVFTTENVIDANQPNKGFKNISKIQFGNKKFDWVTIVKQELNPGEERLLSIWLERFEKTDHIIKDIHVRCILSINSMHVGDKKISIENIPIIWIPSTHSKIIK
jgi:hypothetical protein